MIDADQYIKDYELIPDKHGVFIDKRTVILLLKEISKLNKIIVAIYNCGFEIVEYRDKVALRGHGCLYCQDRSKLNDL